LPKFTEWIDDVVENGGKGARILENTLVDDYIRLSKELVEATKSKTLYQNTYKLDELYEAAKVANKELKTTTNNFAIETKGEAGFRDGLKSKERALEKIESDYAGDTSRLVDIAGSKVVYETVDDLYIALNKFNKEYKILKIKDRIQKPVNGYRDVLINIQAKNGHIVEFRLHLKEMDEVANGIGHKLYEEVRAIKARAITENRKLSLDEFKKINDIENKSLKIYDEAWEKIKKLKK
jgi:Region found in RelA / SpoT proteins